MEDSFAENVHVNVDGVVRKDRAINVGFVKKKHGGVIANVSTLMFKVVGILNALYFKFTFLLPKI